MVEESSTGHSSGSPVEGKKKGGYRCFVFRGLPSTRYHRYNCHWRPPKTSSRLIFVAFNHPQLFRGRPRKIDTVFSIAIAKFFKLPQTHLRRRVLLLVLRNLLLWTLRAHDGVAQLGEGLYRRLRGRLLEDGRRRRDYDGTAGGRYA